jgi:putative ABC transport system ATP-binding protein
MRNEGNEHFIPPSFSNGTGMQSANKEMLLLDRVEKTYRSGDRSLAVLQDISFRIEAGESWALTGPSGSGKTTLLGLCAGLDRPTRGRVIVAGHPLEALDEDACARLRNDAIGFIFQSFRLLPSLTALQNVMIPAEMRGDHDALERAQALLAQVGLADRMGHYPTQLSGGEQQRVALARAFINRPRLLLADEPTGNLDAETSRRIVPLLFDLNRSQGTTLVVATHDPEVAGQTQHTLRLRGGRIENQVRN